MLRAGTDTTKEAFEAEQANYYAMRDFNHESRIKDWKRANEIQDYRYLSDLKQFEKSLTISGQQLDINADATDVALESEKLLTMKLLSSNSSNTEILLMS